MKRLSLIPRRLRGKTQEVVDDMLVPPAIPLELMTTIPVIEPTQDDVDEVYRELTLGHCENHLNRNDI